MKKTAKKAKKELLKKKPDREELVQIKDEDLLSTGYVPLNTAASGRIKGGYGKGLIILIVGDSATGKTWLSDTCLAEATLRTDFDKYEFYYDNIERGNMINLRRFFGREVERRLKPPRGTKKEPVYSETAEELYWTIDDLIKLGKPFIYIVDSLDGLRTIQDDSKFEEAKQAHKRGKKAAGNYGVSQARVNSGGLRRLVPGLERTGSILIVISQTRDNIGFGFEEKTRSGGKAPRFFAHLELWTSLKKKIKKDVLGKPRHIGSIIQIDIRKNRLTGWEGKIEMPFFKKVGIDDIGGCIDYLVDEGYWKKSNNGINAADFGIKLPREKLVAYIEEQGFEKKLHLLVKKVFHQIEEKSTVKRKRRYV